MKTVYLPLAVILFLLSGCSEPTIDAGTDETTKTSTAKVRESLPE